MFFSRCLCLGLVPMAGLSLSGATFPVLNTNDSGLGSLRQALLDANNTPGVDIISFQIPGSPPFVIAPNTSLPAVLDPVVIDGATQPGYANQPLVRVDGAAAGPDAYGFRLLAGNSYVRGLSITRFSADGIRIEGAGTNVVEGNYIGIGYNGVGDLGNGEGGVSVYRSAGNRIGGTKVSSRNVISGGNLAGIYLIDAASTGNQVVGNYIGTDPSGTVRRPNRENGVVIANAPTNVIGGSTDSARNVISGNARNGIYLLGAGARENVVTGNYIGTSFNGTTVLSNGIDGITISGGVRNLIGGTTPGARNVISGNYERGILLMQGSHQNRVHGNFLGTDVSGTIRLGNGANGVTIAGGISNVVGGASESMRNVISGNQQSGVLLSGTNTFANRIQGNFVGTDWTGTNRLSNSFSGINLSGAVSNWIGGMTAGEGNVISGNGHSGIFIGGTTASGNRIVGNRIGTELTGKSALSNQRAGIWVESPGNVVGGPSLAERNLISGNQQSGVYLLGITASNNVIEGNLIGTDVIGTKAVPNLHAGIGLTNAPNNLIGGGIPGAGNILSGNLDSGIFLLGLSCTNTRVQGNFIGTDLSGRVAIPNGVGGIYLYSSGKNRIGGTNAGDGNLVSGNLKVGIAIGSPGANQNVVQGNWIGTAADGYSPLGNQWHGIELLDTASNNVIGGTEPGAGNRIAFAKTSLYAGVRVRDGCVRNLIRGNTLFSNAGLGIDLGANGVTGSAAGWQNFPSLTSVSGRYLTSVQGTLTSSANKQFQIDFYASPEQDASGHGEGYRWLGSKMVTTAGNGVAMFTADFTNAMPVSRFISATATDSTNNTSEFSASVQIPAESFIDGDNDGMLDAFERAANLNPDLASDAEEDADGDGMRNREEYLAGTNPQDPGSLLQLRMTQANDVVELRFDTSMERRYAVEVSADLTGGWSQLNGATNVAGTGYAVELHDFATKQGARLYRVRAWSGND